MKDAKVAHVETSKNYLGNYEATVTLDNGKAGSAVAWSKERAIESAADNADSGK